MNGRAGTHAGREHLAASSMSEPPLCCHQYKCYVADLATTATTTVLEHLLLIACESHGFNGKPTYFPRTTWPLPVLCTIATSFYNFILTVQLPRQEFFRLDFEIYQTPIIFTGIRNWLTSLQHVPMLMNTQFGIWPHQPSASRLILSRSSQLRFTFLMSIFTGPAINNK